jgi:hypothetical protein
LIGVPVANAVVNSTLTLGRLDSNEDRCDVGDMEGVVGAVRDRRVTYAGLFGGAERLGGEADGEYNELAAEDETEPSPPRRSGKIDMLDSMTGIGESAGGISCSGVLSSPLRRPPILSSKPATLFRSESLKLRGVCEPVEQPSATVAPPELVSAASSSAAVRRRHSFRESGRAGLPFRSRTRLCFALSSCAFKSVFSPADGESGELERKSNTARRARVGAAALGIEAGEGGGGTGDEEFDGGEERRM